MPVPYHPIQNALLLSSGLPPPFFRLPNTYIIRKRVGRAWFKIFKNLTRSTLAAQLPTAMELELGEGLPSWWGRMEILIQRFKRFTKAIRRRHRQLRNEVTNHHFNSASTKRDIRKLHQDMKKLHNNAVLFLNNLIAKYYDHSYMGFSPLGEASFTVQVQELGGAPRITFDSLNVVYPHCNGYMRAESPYNEDQHGIQSYYDALAAYIQSGAVHPDTPFHMVQLPGYDDTVDEPVEEEYDVLGEVDGLPIIVDGNNDSEEEIMDTE